MDTMKAVVFRGVDNLRIEDVPKPRPTAGQAVIRITATTICGTDVHIVRGEYPVRPGLILGHEPVGVIEELGEGLEEYAIGQRVIVGAITPCGQCFYCLNGAHSQCHGPLGGRDWSSQSHAVQCGHWPLYRFDPRAALAGRSPLTIDSRPPRISFTDYAYAETRYRMLKSLDHAMAERLAEEAQRDVDLRWRLYEQLAALHHQAAPGKPSDAH
jgi:Alcohol dehydrogenase GroES-like domain